MFKPFVRRKFTNMYNVYQRIFLSTQGDIDNMLATYLEIDHNVIKQINQAKKDYISKIPKRKVIENCKIMKELNVNLGNLDHLERCLILHPSIVKRRILVLKEMGVRTLYLNHIYRFPTTMRRSIKQFKIIHDIPTTENIMENIIHNIGLPVNESSIIKFDCNLKAGDYYHLCMKHYKICYLHLNNDEFHEQKYNCYQSFQELSEVVNILKTKFNFDEQFLCKHPFLIKQDKNNIESYLSEFKGINIIGNLNITEVVKKFPRLLCYPASKMKELVMLCKKYGIPNVPIISYLSILNIDKEIILIRYLNILNSYELNVWSKHPRVLRLIQFYSMVQTRVEYLKLYNRIATTNIHMLLCNDLIFIRYIQGDINNTNGLKYLSYLLCSEFGEDKAYLLKDIRKHNHWKTVPLLSIAKTIKYLKQNYLVEDICQNIQIIFYSQSIIREAMDTINEEYSAAKGYNFSSSQYLALCLYILEKDYHFNGDAVWQGIDERSLARPNNFPHRETDECRYVTNTLITNDKGIHNINEIAWLEYLLR